MALPLAVLFMSLDEIAEIHEKIGVKSDRLLPDGSRALTPFPHTGIWMFLVGLPFLLVILFVFRRLMRSSTIRASSFRRILFGFLTLVAGTGGVEVWANFTFDDPLMRVVQVSLEEGLELVGGTLIVWGAEDRYLPLLWGERLRGDIPGVERMEVVPEAGHFWQEERPGPFVAHIRSFLNRHRVEGSLGPVVDAAPVPLGGAS